jgi:hypothetical protein
VLWRERRKKIGVRGFTILSRVVSEVLSKEVVFK